MAEKIIFTQAEMDEACAKARAGAWNDLLCKFSVPDKRRIANLLAHKWHVVKVTIGCTWDKPTEAVAENADTFGVPAVPAPQPLRHSKHLCADCTTEHACQHRLDLPRPCWGAAGVQPSDGGQEK